MDAQEQAEKIILAKIKQMETQAKKFEDKVNVLLKEIIEIDKENKKLSENEKENQEKINANNAKKSQLFLEIKKINQEKEKALGCDLQLAFRDDSAIKTELPI